MKLEPYLSGWVQQIQQHSSAESDKWETGNTPFIKRLPKIIHEAWNIVRGVLLYILIGIGIGALMHGYVPEGFSNNIWPRTTGSLFRFLSFLLYRCMPMLPESFR